MAAFPPEIWLHIFPYACLDGGFTGNSLSLTSKQFYALSSESKWLSIALNGPDQMCRFIATYKRSTQRRRIRHLLLSWYRYQSPPANFSAEALSGIQIVDAILSVQLDGDTRHYLREKLADDEPSEEVYHERIRSTKEACRSASKGLLPLVADDLITLFTTFTFVTHIPKVFRSLVFPNLEELTVGASTVILFSPPPLVTDPLFPSLRYLHTVYGASGVEYFTRCAPKLTHLRLSSVGCVDAGSVTRSILHIISKSSEPDPDGVLPRSIQRIILQGPGDERRYLDPIRTRDAMQQFGTLLQSDARDVIRILGPLPRSTCPESYEQYCWSFGHKNDDISTDWKIRIAGGIGSWRDEGEEVFSLKHSTREELEDIFGMPFDPTSEDENQYGALLSSVCLI